VLRRSLEVNPRSEVAANVRKLLKRAPKVTPSGGAG
jgi:hypothetical protein